MSHHAAERLPTAAPSLATVFVEWGRLGCIGFGGPPAHIELLRALCVDRKRWLDAAEFEDAIATCNLLPGPASTQLAIYCAWRVRGPAGAVVGGAAFIVPGLVLILALAALFLEGAPPTWVRGAGSGAGAAVAAVAVHAGIGLLGPSWARRHDGRRWIGYAAVGGAAAAVGGAWVVIALIACGLVELTARRSLAAPAGQRRGDRRSFAAVAVLVAAVPTATGLGQVAWVALKVGALSYGGGFVIIPLMQHDAVDRYHWLTPAQFLDAVALGQITPGPVVHTVAAVGYGAAGLSGGLLAAVVAFAPSFAIVLVGARRFDRIRTDRRASAFLGGSGPAAIGAIFGSAIPLIGALGEAWQFVVLAAAGVMLLALRQGVVVTLLAAAATGVVVALAGGPLPT